jgi:hypothetical protein
MERDEVNQREVERLERQERQSLHDSLMFRFDAYLRPGESLTVDAERSDEYVYTQVVLESADETLRLELEASVLAADQQVESFADPQEALDLAFEYLKIRLREFFTGDRQERFHVDWRIYEVEGTAVRFRGELRKPEIEKRADELLDEADDQS